MFIIFAGSAVPLEATDLAMSALHKCDAVEDCNSAKLKTGLLDLPNEVRPILFLYNMGKSHTHDL